MCLLEEEAWREELLFKGEGRSLTWTRITDWPRCNKWSTAHLRACWLLFSLSIATATTPVDPPSLIPTLLFFASHIFLYLSCVHSRLSRFRDVVVVWRWNFCVFLLLFVVLNFWVCLFVSETCRVIFHYCFKFVGKQNERMKRKRVSI